MNKFVKYLLCFFVGFLIARMIGDGFGVGAIESSVSQTPIPANCRYALENVCNVDKSLGVTNCLACIPHHQHLEIGNNCKQSNYNDWCNEESPGDLCPSNLIELNGLITNKTYEGSFNDMVKFDGDNIGVCVNKQGNKITANANTRDLCYGEKDNNHQWCNLKFYKYEFRPSTNKELQEAVDALLEIDQTGNGLVPEANNIPISDWDTSLITDMTYLFYSSGRDEKFNADISGWDVSNVIYMGSMFYGAAAFNQDISRWKVSNVLYMGSMFYGAKAFDRDLSGWDVRKVISIDYIFRDSGINNYFYCLRKWNVKSVKVFNYPFTGCKFARDFANNQDKYPDLEEIFEIDANGNFNFKHDTKDNPSSLKTQALYNFFNRECDPKCPSCKTS